MNKITLDTNTLLDYKIDFLIESIEEPTAFILPFDVILELDYNKDNYLSRYAIRFIYNLIKPLSHITGPIPYKQHSIMLMQRIGTINDTHPQGDSIDASILKQASAENSMIMTSDLHMVILAKIYNIKVQMPPNKEVEERSGYTELDLSDTELAAIYEGTYVPTEHMEYNHYVSVCRDDKKCLYRYNGETLKPISQKTKINIVKAKPNNTEQKILLDLLGDKKIELLTVIGPAGSGKTYLTTAAALQLTQDGIYDKVLIMKPLVNIGKDMGALPGTKLEKLNPWLACSVDAINSLPRMDCDRLMEEGKLEFEALNYLRGRSIPNQFIIVEDAQNLTKKQAATIITRCGEGSKIVLLGDISMNQIDRPNLDPIDNGLAYVIKKLYGKDPVIAHIQLKETVRSRVAQLGVQYLTEG